MSTPPPPIVQELSEALKALNSPKRSTSAPTLTWLIAEGSRGLITLTPSSAGHVRVCAAAGRSLARALEQEEQMTLYGLGFKRRSAADPFEQELPIANDADRGAVALMTEQLLERLYLQEGERAQLTRRERPQEGPDNSKLIAAMRRLSQERSESARQKLYWALVRAQLLLALQEPLPTSLLHALHERAPLNEQLKGHELLDLHTLTGYSSAAVFCSFESAHRYDLRGPHLVAVQGRALLPLLLERKVGSLLINPHGQIGGELYRNELMMMEQALKAWEAR